MNWPLMRRRTHMRIYTQQGESYRREIQEARWDVERARADLKAFVDSLAPRIDQWEDFPTGNKRISVEINSRAMRCVPRDGLLALVRDSIMRRLVEMDRDYRGDMRQTPNQRAFGL